MPSIKQKSTSNSFACKNTSNNVTSKCAHVLLIGDLKEQDITSKIKQFELTQYELLSDKSKLENNYQNGIDQDKEDEEFEENKLSLVNTTNYLYCNDCKCFKNLWLCLRENCLYVGCGQDQGSNKHSSLHAIKNHHPLSINLTNKSVWCELCSTRVYLDSNKPQFSFKSKNFPSLNANINTNCSIVVQDYDLINYLDQEICSKPNNESYKDDFDEYENKDLQCYGQLGLDNLGNTCYMNAALQALSNCFAFTSYFLECSSYVQQQSLLNKQSSSKNVSLSLNYMKLMRDLWQNPNRMNLKTNKMEEISSLTPVDLVHTVKLINPMFRGYQQNDSQEFLIYLMDQLHEELKRPVLVEQNSQEEQEEREEEVDQEVDEEEEERSENENNIKQCNSDKDSGVSSFENGSHQSKNSSDHDERDSESIDSYVTCGDINDNNCSELSDDKLDYSDADECFSCSNIQNRKNLSQKSKNIENNKVPVYTSIISETFEGKLISQVKCLECNNISTTTESFQHLSLPIPSKEYLQALQSRVNLNNKNDQSYQSWLGWIMDFMKGYVWSSTIKLSDCLAAFFSDDDLKGDNMYSCEKCKKLTNGIKYSKILNLPEVLIIHLKRFRHDSMFSTGKINSFISFPTDNLNMQPFVHNECRNEITQYDLNSVICHYGSSSGGHYISYGRNYFNEEWYEYDDSYCRQIDSLTVQNSQAYVLFYKKKNIKTDSIKDQLRNLFSSKTLTNNDSLLRPYYVSKQWLHKLKYFGESGPIDNTDFICKHNFVNNNLWKIVDNLAIACSEETWLYLEENFSVKYKNSELNYLFPCKQCQLDDEEMKQRQTREKNEFIRLKDKWNLEQLNGTNKTRVFAISITWFKEWEKFVQMIQCPMRHQVPSKINNLSICLPVSKNSNQKEFQLNQKSNYFKINKEMWDYLYALYGGGPELEISNKNLPKKYDEYNLNKSKSYTEEINSKRKATNNGSTSFNGNFKNTNLSSSSSSSSLNSSS